jgi:hypothetical protein
VPLLVHAQRAVGREYRGVASGRQDFIRTPSAWGCQKRAGSRDCTGEVSRSPPAQPRPPPPGAQGALWKYLPSWELAGRANRSPTELGVWAAAQWHVQWGADSLARGTRGIRRTSASRVDWVYQRAMRDSQGIKYKQGGQAGHSPATAQTGERAPRGSKALGYGPSASV